MLTPTKDGEKNDPIQLNEIMCHSFSLIDIKLATNDFDDTLIIGNGGFGKVYKGTIDNGDKVVAIKRLNQESKQGEDEFWAEVSMLSKLRHTNLIALIGYCNESYEMILVYEYISKGTIAEHIYENNDIIFPRLTWEQRLNICIGAARGLDYLHGGTSQGFIHRDIKAANILLDENLIAKIGDFGLSKCTNTLLTTHITTNVKGTFGYVDPDYFITRRLTKKSDVYAFGVVMLEVLCGRKAVDLMLEEEQIGLVSWVKECTEKGEINKIFVNRGINDEISLNSLKKFLKIATKCLRNRPQERPTMDEVVTYLEHILMLQYNDNGTMSKAYSLSKQSVATLGKMLLKLHELRKKMCVIRQFRRYLRESIREY